MTGAGGPAPAPGWYPDPDGAAGMVRWWSGSAWSDVTTPAGPGVTVQRSAVLAPPPSPSASSSGWMGAPPGRAGARDRWGRGTWAAIAGVVVAAAIAAVVALVSPHGSGGTAASQPAAAASGPAGPTFAPGTVLVVDRAAGISYPFLGNGWYEYALAPELETTSTAGQYFTTQPSVPGGGEFIAQCTSGPVAAGYGWAGSASLHATAGLLADSVRANYYPAPNERRVLRDEQRTVDGHPAWLVEFDLAWHVPGYDATGERAALLLVDVGRPAPALLYVSIPNTHAELYADIDGVLANVHVL